jgi:hypothetical protein
MGVVTYSGGFSAAADAAALRRRSADDDLDTGDRSAVATRASIGTIDSAEVRIASALAYSSELD